MILATVLERWPSFYAPAASLNRLSISQPLADPAPFPTPCHNTSYQRASHFRLKCGLAAGPSPASSDRAARAADEQAFPPPNPHPLRAHPHAESSAQPTRASRSTAFKNPTARPTGGGSPASWRARPPGAQARPDRGFFACLSKSEKGISVFAFVCRRAKDRIWNSKDKKLLS